MDDISFTQLELREHVKAEISGKLLSGVTYLKFKSLAGEFFQHLKEIQSVKNTAEIVVQLFRDLQTYYLDKDESSEV